MGDDDKITNQNKDGNVKETSKQQEMTDKKCEVSQS